MRTWTLKFSEVRGEGPLGTNVAITASGTSPASQLFIGDLDGWAGKAFDSQTPLRTGVAEIELDFERVYATEIFGNQRGVAPPGQKAPFYRLICHNPLTLGVEVSCISLAANADPVLRKLEVTEIS